MGYLALLSLVAAYLIGSINFAVIFSKIFMKKDVREVGSGNAGATNVLRSAGILPGILTFLCDALKGFAAAYIGLICFKYSGIDFMQGIYGAYICGLFCMIGHVFPIFFKFKGGKGVAVSVGIFSVCCPIAIALGLAAFTLVTVLSRMVSLGSIIATVVVVVLSGIFYDTDASFWAQYLPCLAMGFIVIIKHKDNIKRLINGTESKFGKKG